MPCLRSGSGTPSSRSSVRGRAVSRAASSLPPEAVLARRIARAIWCSWRHLDEMLTFGVCHGVTSAIDAGSFPLKWPPTPRRRTPASVVARLSGRPRRCSFRGFIRARTRPRSDARPPRGTRSSSGRIGHRIPIRRVGLVLGTRHYGSFLRKRFYRGSLLRAGAAAHRPSYLAFLTSTEAGLPLRGNLPCYLMLRLASGG